MYHGLEIQNNLGICVEPCFTCVWILDITKKLLNVTEFKFFGVPEKQKSFIGVLPRYLGFHFSLKFALFTLEERSLLFDMSNGGELSRLLRLVTW